jgi:hypothetical protein
MDMKTLLERMKQPKPKPQPSPELQKFIERIKQRKAELDAKKHDNPTP